MIKILIVKVAFQTRQNGSAQPVVTFIVIITLGIILAVGVNKNENYRLPIILISFFLGFFIAGLELRTMIRLSREFSTTNDHELTRDEKVARYVADLFEDDISFNEQQNEEE